MEDIRPYRSEENEPGRGEEERRFDFDDRDEDGVPFEIPRD